VIRLLPRSLFGRLVLVMLAGLLIAQLITLYINMSERDRLLYSSGGLYAAQRIADLATVLDSMPPDERRKMTAIFDGPPLAIDLDRAPLAAPSDDPGGDLQLAMFTAMLRRGCSGRCGAGAEHLRRAAPAVTGARTRRDGGNDGSSDDGIRRSDADASAGPR